MTKEELKRTKRRIREILDANGFAPVDTYINQSSDCWIETWTQCLEHPAEGTVRKTQILIFWTVDKDDCLIGVHPGFVWQIGPEKYCYPPDAEDPLNQARRVCKDQIDFLLGGPKE